MPHERRLAVVAAIGLVITLFLPWYQETIIASDHTTKLQSASVSLTGWGAFSFVEAAVLVVALGVLALLFQRAEGRAFHLPGGDGGVILAAGLWTCVLVIWRIFDKQGTSGNGQFANTSGVEWGIFVALAVAAFLAYTGSRIRAAHQPEPPLPGDEDEDGDSWFAEPAPRTDRRPRRRTRPAPTAASRPRPAPQPTPRPRRARPASADELARTEMFERVVPEDPPTLKLGRPSTAAAQRRAERDRDDAPTIPHEPESGDE